MNAIKYFNKFNKITRAYSTIKPVSIPGTPKYTDNTKDVSLRGIYLKGKYNDLPNLIFFAEACDLN